MMNNSEKEQKHKAMGMLVAAAMCWSIAGIFIKLLPWEPILIAGLRSLIAASATGLFMLCRHMRFRLTRWSLFTGVFVGLVCGTFVFATKMTTAANAIVIQYSSPVFVLLIGMVFFKKPLKRRDVLAVLAVFSGIALFFFDQLSPGNMAGNIVSIFAALWLALVYTGNSRAGDTDEARFTGLVIGHALCGLLTIPGLLLYPFHPAGNEIVYILVLGLVQIALPYILLVYAGKYCSALETNLITMLEPIFNPVWVLLFYGEKPGIYALFGAAVIIASVTVWTIIDARAESAEQLKTAAGMEAPPRES